MYGLQKIEETEEAFKQRQWHAISKVQTVEKLTGTNDKYISRKRKEVSLTETEEEPMA